MAEETKGCGSCCGGRKPGAVPVGEAVDLAGLAEYGDGSIVSRTIAETETATLTLFAFDAGQGLSEHSAPFDAFVQIVDGEAALTIGGQPVKATAGQIVLMPANIPHAVQAKGRFKMLLTMLRTAGGCSPCK